MEASRIIEYMKEEMPLEKIVAEFNEQAGIRGNFIRETYIITRVRKYGYLRIIRIVDLNVKSAEQRTRQKIYGRYRYIQRYEIAEQRGKNGKL